MTTGPGTSTLLIERDELTTLVERLLELTGAAPDPERVRGAVRDAWLDPAGDAGDTTEPGWTQRLLRTLAAVGLRGSRGDAPIERVVESAGPGHPVVLHGRIGEREGLLVVTERRGRRVRVEGPGDGEARWIPASRLGQIAASTASPASWIAVDAAMPLAKMAEPALGSHHGAHPPPEARLVALMKLEREDLSTVLVYAAAIGVLGLTTPIAVQALVSTVAFGTVLQPLVVLTVLLLVALAISGLLRALQAWVVEVLQRRFFVRVVGDLAHRLPRVRRDALDGHSGPELVNRFFDVFTVQKTGAALLLGGLEIALTVVVGTIVLAFYHPLLLALDVMLVVVIGLTVWGLARRGTDTAIVESRAKYSMAAWLQEIAHRDSEIKLAGGHRFALDRADLLARSYLVARERHWSVVFRQLLAMLVVQAVASAAVLGVGGWLVIGRQLTLGQLVAAELVVTAVVASIAKIGKHLESYYDLLAALEKLGHLADLPVERDGGMPLACTGPARVRLDRVRGGYGDHEVLAGVSTVLEAGEKVVVTGPSAGGKSLLVEMIAGLREPSGGRLEIDGYDVRDVALEPLRERIAAVTRTATLPGTILENVGLGRDSVDPKRVRDALVAVGLDQELELLPDGLRTTIAPDGSPLSDGQALRLTVARAIAAAPSLLVIDHVLDGIDDATREPLLEAIFAPDAPWTLIVVSADPNVMARADRVLALQDGALVERSEGTAR